MKKKALFSLLLAAVMVLSGCSLVLRDDNVDAKQSVIVVNGEHVTKQNFMNVYNYNLSQEQYYAQMMAQFGISDGAVDEANVMQSTVNTYISSLVLSQKAAELGFDQFDEAETAAIEAEAAEQYAAQLDAVKTSYFADSELEGDALDAAVREYAASMGYTQDYYNGSVRNSHISDRLRSSVTDSVSINDEDLQAALDSKIAEEKSSYESNANAFATALKNGTTIYYTPSGYRTIRVIEIAKPAEETPAEAEASEEQAAESAEKPAAEEPAVDAQAEAEALAQRIAKGEAFDALGADVTEYTVCADSTNVDAALVAAVMELTEEGAVTGVVETEKGFAIAQYAADIAEHTATLEEARDSLYDETLKKAQDDAYDAAVQAWVDAADITTYLDRLN